MKYGNNLAAPRIFDIFSSPRLLIREIAGSRPYYFHATYTEEVLLNNRSIINILHPKNDKTELLTLLGIINSKLISWYYTKTNPKANRSMFPKLILQDLSNFPIARVEKKDKEEIYNLVNKIITTNQSLNNNKSRSLEVLTAKFNIKNNANLNNFYKLGWNDFIIELEKQKIDLDVSEQDKLNKWFSKTKQTLLSFETKVKYLDCELDQIIYKLYGLTAEEIKTVEQDN